MLRIPKIKDPVQMSASFTPAVADLIEAEADRQNVPKSAIIRGLVDAGIKAVYDTKEAQDG